MKKGHKIPTAIPTFSGSNNTVGSMWMLSDVEVTGKSNMAPINRKYMSNNLYLCNEIPTATSTF